MIVPHRLYNKVIFLMDVSKSLAC